MKHSAPILNLKTTVLTVLRLFTLCAFLMSPYMIASQITVPSSTFPVAGDKLKYKTAANPSAAISLFTPPGGNQTWDLSGLTEANSFEENYRPATEGANAASFPDATSVVINGTNEYYYKASSSKLELLGIASTQVGGVTLKAIYINNPALTVRHAPLNFFDIFSQASGNLLSWSASEIPVGAFTLPAKYDSVRFRIAYSMIEAVDAWGTLTLPGQSQFSVLRLKKTVYKEQRIDAKVPPLGWLDVTDNVIQGGGPWAGLFGVDTTYTHHYFNDVSKEEIAVLTFNTAQNAVTSVVYKNTNTCPNGLVTPSVSLSVSPNPILCAGTSVTVTATPTNGGTAPTYKWFLNNIEIVGETSATLTRSTFTNNDVVKVVMTSNADCTSATTATNSTTISQPTAIALSTSVVNVTCNGGSNGSIDLTVSGGTPGYTYLWNSGQTTQDRTGLTAGTYTVTVTDANGCIKTTSATVMQPKAISITSTLTNVACNGGSNGSIDLTVVGGTPGYTYRWNTGQTTQDLTSLGAGTYTVTVTDANACTQSKSFIITQPSELNLSTTQANVTCNGGSNGSIDLTVSGGAPGYTYQWNTGQTTQDLTGLKAGTYTVTVTDANACTKSTSVTITEPSSVTASVALSAVPGTTICAGTSVTFTAIPTNGGTNPTYKWSINNLVQAETGATLTRGSLVNNDVVKVEMTSNATCVSSTTATDMKTMTVIASPNITAVNSKTYCAGSVVPSVIFTSDVPGATFSWSRTNEAIGLSTNSGTGNIPSFTATNNGTTPLVATFSAVASFTSNGITCTGKPIQFSITINPAPTINAVTNKTYCPSTNVPSVVFSSNISGATFTWSRTNEAIGLPTNSGTGNIPAFTATNSGTTPLTTTISAVASFTNNGTTCTGTPIQFTITVSPLPTITCPLPPVSPINCPSTPVFGTATSSNASVTFADTKTPGSCPGNYKITRTWTAANGCIPVATCSQSVTVQDTEKPTVTKTGELASCYPTLAAAEKAALGLTKATDNCSINLIKKVTTSGTCPFIITVKVTDECGNSESVNYTLPDIAAIGGSVFYNNRSSYTICPTENIGMTLSGYVGRIITWQRAASYVVDPRNPGSAQWQDIPGTAGIGTYMVNGNDVDQTYYYRCVICATCGICAPPYYTNYSNVFTLYKRIDCTSTIGSQIDKDKFNFKALEGSVYPSPADNTINLVISGATEGPAQINIADITGKVVLNTNQALRKDFNEIRMDINTLPTGLYFIKIKDSDNREAIVKLIKL